MAHDDGVGHAYPPKQITVKVQGTRHSSKTDLIELLEIVLARLQQGDATGTAHDDDFGYWFELREAVNGPSFFDMPANSD